jgi:perosamine synthetase
MRPRLILDISYADLWSICAPLKPNGAINMADTPALFVKPTVCLSARSAFHALLQTLALPQAAPIVYSAITIETMVAIAQEHQLKPHFVDVDAATMLPNPADLDAVLTQTGAKIVVISQLFGCVSSLQGLGDVCRKHGALLVEDCAQAFSGDFHLGDPAADFSLFSFGPIKRFTALGGGIIVGKNEPMLEQIAHIVSTWPRKADAWFVKRAAKFLALKLASTPFIYTALLRTLSALGKDADAIIGRIARGFQAGSITPQLQYQPSPRQQRLLARRLAATHATKHSETRAQAAHHMVATTQKLLPNLALERLGSAALKNAYWLMPVLVAEPDKVVLQLRQLGYDGTQGATSMRAFHTTQQPCPNAQHIMQHVVYLPL